MPHRRIKDESGRWWDVWDTRPTIIDRRGGSDRRNDGRAADDRRQKSEARVAVEPQYRKGWLAFQSDEVWHRLAPIPTNWHALSDAQLLALLKHAASAEQHEGAAPASAKPPR